MKRISMLSVMMLGVLTSTPLALEPTLQSSDCTIDYSFTTVTRKGLELTVLELRNAGGQLEVTLRVRWSLWRPTWRLQLINLFKFHFTNGDGKCTTIDSEQDFLPEQFKSGKNNESIIRHKITVPPGAVSLVVEFEGTELKTRPVPIPRR